MSRPIGKQIAVICCICGTVKNWPPSKAEGKRYCSRDCRDAGVSLANSWGRFLNELARFNAIPHFDPPPIADPMDRVRVADGAWFVRGDSQWFRLEIEDRRITSRQSIEAKQLPPIPKTDQA